MADFFSELGAHVEDAWHARDLDPRALPEIAARVLEDAATHEYIRPVDILRWAQQSPNLPRQEDPGAAGVDFAVTLYAGQRFAIRAHFALDGATPPHEHDRAGAYQVLAGAALQGLYRFDERRRVSPHLRLGELHLEDLELLARGDVRALHADGAYIHTLFRLDRPTVTLAIVSTRLAHAGPPLRYLGQHVGYDPEPADEALARRIQSVRFLLEVAHPEADAMLQAMVAGSDLHTAVAVLLEAFTRELPAARFGVLLDTARERHGALADDLPAVFAALDRRRTLLARRGGVDAPELRFFLALLLEAPDRPALHALLRRRHPGRDPADAVVDAVRALGRPTGRPSPARDAAPLNALGLPLDGIAPDALRGVLAGLDPDALRALPRPDPTADNPYGAFARAEELHAAFHAAAILRPLFRA